jgi:Glycine zipper
MSDALQKVSVTTMRVLGLATLALLVVGCAEQPSASQPHHGGPPPAPAPEPAPPPPPQSAQVYVYPTKGQSPEQLDRDRYECHIWAVRQTNFDPSEPRVAPHQRVQVVAMPPPGTSTIAGAATGAIVGAAVSSPWNTGSGAAIGAVAGALIGATADHSRQQQAEQAQQHYDQRDAAANAHLEQQSGDYRRAISACLEGRGYTVK